MLTIAVSVSVISTVLAGDVTDVAIADSEPVVAYLDSEGVLAIVDARSGEVRKESSESFPSGWNLDLSPDGRCVALLTRDDVIYSWTWQDEESPREAGKLAGEPAIWKKWRFGCRVEFSPDGRRLFVARPRSDRLLLDASGERVAVIPREDVSVPKEPTESGYRVIHASGFDVPLAWSRDGARLAVVTVGAPRVHSSETGERLDLDLEPFEPLAESLAFSPDGKALVAGHHTGRVVRWNLETGKKDWVFEHVDPVFGVHGGEWSSLGIGDLAFSPDGSELAATTITSIYALLLDPASGEQTWIGPHCGGRMGEPAVITWTADRSRFFHAYVSGVMPIQLVHPRANPVEGVDPADIDRSKAIVQRDLGCGTPVDLGWSGIAVFGQGDRVVAFDTRTDEIAWGRDD